MLAASTRRGVFLYRRDGTRIRRVNRLRTTRQHRVGSIAFSPNGRQLLVEGPVTDTADGGMFFTMDLRGRGSHRIGRLAGYQPRWSPDGRSITFIAPSPDGVIETWGNLQIASPSERKPRRLYAPPATDAVSSFDWSPNGRQVVVELEDNGTGAEGCADCPGGPTMAGIALIDRRGRLLRHLGQGSNPVWSPDGRRLAFIAAEGAATRVVSVNRFGGERRVVKNLGDMFVFSLDWAARIR